MFGKEKAQKQPETLGEFIRSILIAILFAMGIQTVAYQTFNIPSGSMKPNLLIGDFIFVSKFAYGYTHYSIPFSPPLFEGRLFGSEPKRIARIGLSVVLVFLEIRFKCAGAFFLSMIKNAL